MLYTVATHQMAQRSQTPAPGNLLQPFRQGSHFQLHSHIRYFIPISSGACEEDKMHFFLMFLHFCKSVHDKLVCRDRLSLLIALYPLALQESYLWCKTGAGCSEWFSFGKTNKQETQHTRMGEKSCDIGCESIIFLRLNDWC